MSARGRFAWEQRWKWIMSERTLIGRGKFGAPSLIHMVVSHHLFSFLSIGGLRAQRHISASIVYWGVSGRSMVKAPATTILPRSAHQGTRDEAHFIKSSGLLYPMREGGCFVRVRYITDQHDYSTLQHPALFHELLLKRQPLHPYRISTPSFSTSALLTSLCRSFVSLFVSVLSRLL